MKTILDALVTLGFIGVVLGIVRLTYRADRRRICRMIAQAGGEVISLESINPSKARWLLSASNTTFWRVKYRTPQQEIRIADCSASFLRCKMYSNRSVDDSVQTSKGYWPASRPWSRSADANRK